MWKKTGLEGVVFFLLILDDTNDILDINKYLMKKNMI